MLMTLFLQVVTTMVYPKWNNMFATIFSPKNLDKLKYFLDIEVAQSNDDIVITQRKYGSNILEETELMNSKTVDNGS